LRIETKEDAQHENSKFHNARLPNSKKTQTTIIHNKNKNQSNVHKPKRQKKPKREGKPFFELTGSEKR